MWAETFWQILNLLKCYSLKLLTSSPALLGAHLSYLFKGDYEKEVYMVKKRMRRAAETRLCEKERDSLGKQQGKGEEKKFQFL